MGGKLPGQSGVKAHWRWIGYHWRGPWLGVPNAETPWLDDQRAYLIWRDRWDGMRRNEALVYPLAKNKNTGRFGQKEGSDTGQGCRKSVLPQIPGGGGFRREAGSTWTGV